jgi:phosphatidylglycerophosphatase C
VSAVTIAAFDFDETLTTSDSVVPFLRRFTTTSRFAVSLLPHALRLLPMAASRDRDRLRALATQIVFGGRPILDVEDAGRAWGVEIAESRLRADTTARLRWHLEQGHHVAIVSASYEQYVRVVADMLGDREHDVEVLATGLEAVDGRCTGRLAGANCRGAEKVRRLEGWLAASGWQRDDVTVHAYGDSSGDREMLAWADHPHWVNDPLASVAL